MAAVTNDSSKKEFNFTTFHNVINGELKTTSTTRHGISPHTKKPLAEVPLSTAKDVDDAVAAARAAFPKWKKTSFEERAKGLTALGATIYEYQQEFIKLNGYELGVPVSIAEILVHMGAGWLSETAKLQPKDEIVEDTPEREVRVRYLPLGVAVGIVPWNLPLHCTAAKIAAAVIAGNCIIIKPSPYTPYSGLKLVEMAQKFFPPGVVQVLSGDDSLGRLLTEHPGVDKISFTGSTATGKKVMESASKSLRESRSSLVETMQPSSPRTSTLPRSLPRSPASYSATRLRFALLSRGSMSTKAFSKSSAMLWLLLSRRSSLERALERVRTIQL